MDEFSINQITPSKDIKQENNYSKNGNIRLYSYKVFNNWDEGSIGYYVNIDIYPDSYNIRSYDYQDILNYQEKSEEKYFIVEYKEMGEYNIRISAYSNEDRKLGEFKFPDQIYW